MGLALAQSLEQREHGYESGFLRDTFSQGGVSEVTTAEILSIEKFLRAEESLGHIPPESINDINDMHVEHTDDVTHYLFEKKLRGYNEDDIMSEQSGDLHKSDGDVVTAGGYMKTTVSTTGHEKNKEERHRRQMQQHLFALEQNERLSELMAELEALKVELKKIEEQIAEVDEVQQLLADGDLNDTTDIAAARRKRVESLLKKQGKSLSDYERADGTIDQERLQRDLDAQRDDLDRQRQQTIDAIEDNLRRTRELKNEQSQEVQTALNNGDSEKLNELAEDYSNAEARIAMAEQSDQFADRPAFALAGLSSQDDLPVTASNDSDWGFEDASPELDTNEAVASDNDWGDDWSFASNDTEAVSTDTISGERSYGSFAADADAQDNSVITGMFAQVSDPAAVAAQQQAELDAAASLEQQGMLQQNQGLATRTLG